MYSEIMITFENQLNILNEITKIRYEIECVQLSISRLLYQISNNQYQKSIKRKYQTIILMAISLFSWSTSFAEEVALNQPLNQIPNTNGLEIEGRDIFNSTCSHCHGKDAIQKEEQRKNLRLLQHKYGEKMDDVFIYTVTHGRTSKGMPNWSGIISNEDFIKIRAFLHSIQILD